MSSAQLFNIPKTVQERAVWVFANADSHNNIVTAVAAQKNVQLQSYVLDPLETDDLQNFLLRHQFMHDQMDNVLGIGGNDYTGLDINDPSGIEYIWQQHANEHILAETKLGI